MTARLETWVVEEQQPDGEWRRYGACFDDEERATKYMTTLCGREGYRVVQYIRLAPSYESRQEHDVIMREILG